VTNLKATIPSQGFSFGEPFDPPLSNNQVTFTARFLLAWQKSFGQPKCPRTSLSSGHFSRSAFTTSILFIRQASTHESTTIRRCAVPVTMGGSSCMWSHERYAQRLVATNKERTFVSGTCQCFIPQRQATIGNLLGSFIK
jgi:hypothetical protein